MPPSTHPQSVPAWLVIAVVIALAIGLALVFGGASRELAACR